MRRRAIRRLSLLGVCAFAWPIQSQASSTPAIVVAPTAIDFGERPAVAGPTDPQSVTITNDSEDNRRVTSVGLDGLNASAFSIDTDSGEAFLPPGATRTIAIVFEPTIAGAKLARLRITSDDPCLPSLEVPLSGTATNALPEIMVTPTSLQFGEQPYDAGPTETETVTITNVGSTQLSLSSVSVVGPSLVAFPVVSDTGEPALEPGQSRSVVVVFDPETAGGRLAILRVLSDDADEAEVDIPLRGTALEPMETGGGCAQSPLPGAAWGVLALGVCCCRRRRDAA